MIEFLFPATTIGFVVTLRIVMGGIPERFFATAELGVAVMLVLLGGWALLIERRRCDTTPVAVRTATRALGFGVAHGLAGRRVVIVLRIAASSRVLVPVGYLAAFGVGTVSGIEGLGSA
jgi:hypothetical protein